MRKLMWFTVGFGIACGFCGYGFDRGWVLPAFLGCLALFAISLVFVRTGKWGKKLSAALLGLALSFGWFSVYDHVYLSLAIALDGTTQTVRITATDYSYETDYGIAAAGNLEMDGKTYQVRAYLSEREALSPGDWAEGSFRFRLTTGHGEEEATSHAGKGIFLLAYQQEDCEIHRLSAIPNVYFAAKWRQQIRDILDAAFPEDTSAFAKALLLGDTTDLDYETDTHLKVSGIRHVVAVSGLHISILFALLSLVTFRKRFLMAFLGIPVLAVFAALAGFTPSVVRACIMSGTMVFASVVEKEYDGPSALSLAVLVLLAANPMAATSVSLQLSVASVAGIFCFREPIQNRILPPDTRLKGWKGRIVRSVVTSVAITLSATAFTAPLCACYFGMVSAVALITNLLTLWVISFIFYGLMSVCSLYLCWQTGGMVLAAVIALPVRYVLLVAKALASLPFAAIYFNSVYLIGWLVFCYLLLSVFLLQDRKRPAVLICCACIGLCIALLASWLEPRQEDTRLTVLDVGQGQSILLESQGRTFLIDCGGDSDTKTADLIASTLLSQGVNRLDGIILTHYDRDHAGALENLLTRLETDVLILPDTVNLQTFENRESPVCYVKDMLEIALSDGKITVFGPIYDGADNENSMCVLFEGQECAILINGDRSAFGERMLMRKTQLPDVDVLVAGHHGAKNSTSEELLRAVTPETVIISVGEGNSYGHPAPELLERLAWFGCVVYRTDLHGTVIFRR